MKTKIEMIEKEVNGIYILQDPDWLDDDWVIAPINHPLSTSTAGGYLLI